jgi:hypothetical protein
VVLQQPARWGQACRGEGTTGRRTQAIETSLDHTASPFSHNDVAPSEKYEPISKGFERKDRMVFSFRNSSALFAASLIATLAFDVGAAADSIENQCRVAVRVEMMGPDCRMANPKTSSGGYTAGDPCYILGDTKTAYYVDKVIDCVKRGGPAKR